jgi:broad specificity phosphatase PhoE
MKMKSALATAILACCVFGIAATAAADQIVFVVRHAERADGGQPGGGMMGNDPPLSEAGTARAKRLAAMLASADVKHVFTTELQRTQQTGAPTAAAAKVQPTVVQASDAAGLLAQVRAAAGNVLVVGHSNTVPALLKQLGVTAPDSIPDNEYDNLFVVVRPATGAPALVRLRY